MRPAISASTLPAALDACAARGVGELVFHLDTGVERVTSAELAERAAERARCLVGLGVAPGDRIGLLGPNHPSWAAWAFATWMAGAVLVPIAYPLRVRDSAAFSR